MSMLSRAIEYIDKRPRVILMMAWPVFTALLIWLIHYFMSQHPPTNDSIKVLANISYGILIVFGLNQLAQSIALFGNLGFRIGSYVDVHASSRDNQTAQPSPEPNNNGRT